MSNVKTDQDGPIPIHSVSWAYHSPDSPRAKCKALYRPAAKLPYSDETADPGSEIDVDLELNGDLVGLKAACDVLGVYEQNAGFHYKFHGFNLQEESGIDISRRIDTKDVDNSKKIWDEMVQNLTGIFSEDDSSSSSNDSSSLASSLFDSIEWYTSIPSTPKPYASTSHGISPSSKLNASASSFTPSRLSVPSLSFSDASSPPTTQSSPSPPLYDFEFPSLNASKPNLNPKPSPYPKLKIAKDDQGFVTNIEAEIDSEEATPKSRLHSSTLLPAFLQDEQPRRKSSVSKTRVLVDRLRSTQSFFPDHNGSGCGYSPSPSPEARMTTLNDDESADTFSHSRSGSVSRYSTPSPVHFINDNDGWISVEEPRKSSPIHVNSRKRELILALATPNRHHHRTESGPAAIKTDERSLPSSSSSPMQEPSSSSSTPSSSGSFSSMPPTPPIITDNDGWIEVVMPSASGSSQYTPSRKSSSTIIRPLKKKSTPVSEIDNLTFPTLNSPPPSSSTCRTRLSRSHSRTPSTTSLSSGTHSTGRASKATAVKPKSTHTVAPNPASAPVPVPVPPNYYGHGAYGPPVPGTVSVPYPPYAMMPYATIPVPMPVPVPVPAPPQHQYQSHLHQHQYAYPNQQQQQHTHPHSHSHSHQYPYLGHHQRAHSVAVPGLPLPNSNLNTMQPGYMHPHATKLGRGSHYTALGGHPATATMRMGMW